MLVMSVERAQQLAMVGPTPLHVFQDLPGDDLSLSKIKQEADQYAYYQTGHESQAGVEYYLLPALFRRNSHEQTDQRRNYSAYQRIGTMISNFAPHRLVGLVLGMRRIGLPIHSGPLMST